MKKVLFCFWVSLFVNHLVGQVTNEKLRSSDIILKKSIPIIKMPSFDLEKIKLEDKINDAKKSKVFRFGYEHNVNFGIMDSGIWEYLPNGDRIWRIRVVSKGAKTLNFVFDKYQLPEGATLHLYNPDRSFILGAYTSVMNTNNNSLGTWLADGDDIILEYYVPSACKDVGKLSVGKVVHGYRTVSDFEARQKALNDSGDCHLDVNCSIGEDLDPFKDRLKKAVALILVNATGWCSGTLINNTSNDKAPYMLTAFHCGDGEVNWAFRFNWISENTVCASTEESISNGPENYYQTTSGSVQLAKNAESDFRLIEITGGLDDEWDLEWAGWDRADNAPDDVMSIHHPSGDIMKVSKDDDPPIKQRITIDGQNSAVWTIRDWSMGSTEQVSSGSALFNEKGQIIGQLFGGAAACNGTQDNGEPDFYGRFGVSWDFGDTDDTRLSNWLDPINTDQIALKSLSEELGDIIITNGKLSDLVATFPIPSDGFINVINSSGKFLSYELFDIAGQLVQSGDFRSESGKIIFTIGAAGVYFLNVRNADNDEENFSRKLIIHNEN